MRVYALFLFCFVIVTLLGYYYISESNKKKADRMAGVAYRSDSTQRALAEHNQLEDQSIPTAKGMYYYTKSVVLNIVDIFHPVVLIGFALLYVPLLLSSIYRLVSRRKKGDPRIIAFFNKYFPSEKEEWSRKRMWEIINDPSAEEFDRKFAAALLKHMKEY